MRQETAVARPATLATHLRKLRGTRPIWEVAEALGVSRGSVTFWESGSSHFRLRRAPTAANLGRLLDLYEASPDDRLWAWELRARVDAGPG